MSIAGSMYRANGPGSFRTRREVRVRQRRCAMSASGGYGPAQLNAVIVSHVNLLLATAHKPVLEAEIVAGQRPFSRHPAFLGLGRRAEVAGMYGRGPGLVARPDLSQGLCLPRALGLSLMPGSFIRRSGS